MEWNTSDPARVSRGQWISWGLLLVLVYVALTALVWHRMFIDTEAWALCITELPRSEQLEQIRTDLVHPPLMYLIQRGWLSVFGHTDNAAHALPMVIVSPAILLLTLLATRISAHWRLLSFFLATVFYSVGAATVQVRMYGLALLLVTAALLLWDNWRTNPNNFALCAWTAIILLLVYTHLFGLLLLFAFVVLNWLYGRRKWAFLLAAVVPAVAFLPWLLYVLPIYQSRGLAPNLNWVHQSLLSAIASLFFNFLGGVRLGSLSRTNWAIAASILVHLGLLIMFWFHRARFWPPRTAAEGGQRWFWPAVLLAAIPLSILLSFSLVVARAFEARFVLGAVIPYSIAVFLLCQSCGRAGRIALLCVLLPWKIIAIGNSLYFETKPDAARQTVEFVAAHARAGDLLLVENPNAAGLFYWEWVRRLHRSERIDALPALPDDPLRMRTLPSVPADRLELSGIERIWIFQSGPKLQPEVAGALAARGFFSTEDASRTIQRGAPGVSKLALLERKVSN